MSYLIKLNTQLRLCRRSSTERQSLSGHSFFLERLRLNRATEAQPRIQLVRHGKAEPYRTARRQSRGEGNCNFRLEHLDLIRKGLLGSTLNVRGVKNTNQLDVIGINVGIILLSAENLRSGTIWRWFMENREIPQAMAKVGLIRYDKRNRVTKSLLRKAA